MTQVSLRNIRKNILNRRNNIFFLFLQLFGALSFIIIFGMSVFIYADMFFLINLAFDTLQFLPWPFNLRGNYSLSSNYQAMLNIIKLNVFPENSELNSGYADAVNTRSSLAVQSLNDLLL